MSVTLFAGSAVAQETAEVVPAPAKAKVFNQVRTWSYVGPRGYLAGAKITLTDSKGRTIGKGVTSRRGTYTFRVSAKNAGKLPFTVTTSGGKVTAVAGNGKVFATAFDGHLAARVFGATTRAGVVHVNLISTAADQIAGSRRGNLKAVALVRRALGMRESTPHDVLRLRNSYVGFKQLLVASRKAGGFDEFASHVAKLAVLKKRVGNLKPASANASGAIPARLIRQRPASRQSMGASTTICQVGVPSTGSTSDEVITDVADVGVGTLMKVAGLPTTATNDITGMALGAVGVSGGSVQSQDAQLIASDLDCLGEQINYLSNQIAHLQFTMDVQAANNCVTAITDPNAWEGYNYLLSNPSQMSPSDPSFTGVYLPKWGAVGSSCGGSINNALWGTKGGQDSSWNQLVKNTIGGSKWYSQQQVQQLQTFLSYWGTLVYQQFILSNEYDNYYKYNTAASQAGGATTNSSGQTVCRSGSTYATASFCVYRSNIMQAYPPDLYSDEVGIIKNALAVNAIPVGVAEGAAITNPASGMAATQTKFRNNNATSGSPKSGNPTWFWNYFLNFTPYNENGSGNYVKITSWGAMSCVIKMLNNCPGPQTNSQATNVPWDAANYFNNRGVNPKGYGSAVQTFDNPQKTPKYPNAPSGNGLACGDVSDLNSNNTNGQSGVTALFNGVNQAPNGGNGPWNGLSVGSTSYLVNDSNSWTAGRLTTGTALVAWNPCLGNGNSDGTGYSISSIPQTPVFATLLARTWWAGVATAPTFYPANPVTA